MTQTPKCYFTYKLEMPSYNSAHFQKSAKTDAKRKIKQGGSDSERQHRSQSYTLNLEM